MTALTVVPRRTGARGIGTFAFVAAAIFSLMLTSAAPAAVDPAALTLSHTYKSMSLEELMDVEVSASRGTQTLMQSPSAVQIVTNQDIQRSGATNLAEAIRLAPNANVAQVNSYGYVVTTRGFSNIFANKLLVMIDGRSVYTPLFAGVVYDVQNVPLENVDRIEVVSGPGGTLWGANAVNGVINVVTKSAKDSQGLYLEGIYGSFLDDQEIVQYGGRASKNVYYRVYGMHFDRDNTTLPSGAPSSDSWGLTQGGFRTDWYPDDSNNTITVQGDVYNGREHTAPSDSTLDGQNILARFTHVISEDSDMSLQMYFDHTYRVDAPSLLTDQLVTYDIDFQHRFPLGTRHSILWGVGYRYQHSKITNASPFFGYIPPSRDMPLYSAFIQDEIAIIPDKLALTIGSKFEHNDFTGFEYQPSARLQYEINKKQTVWGAITRAVRTPSRIDTDLFIPTFPLPPTTPHVEGGPNFDSESVIAYESGYRVQPHKNVSLSASSFYNSYDDLHAVEAVPGTQIFQIMNGAEAQSWGIELAATYQATEWWRLRGGYTYFESDIWAKPGHTIQAADLGNDPHNQILIQSTLDLPHGFQFDVVARYVDSLPQPAVDDYIAVDVRIAWQYKNLVLSLVGTNLTDNKHSEFSTTDIPRGFYAKATYLW